MFLPFYRFPLASFFQLIFLSTQFNLIHGTVVQNPPFACVGETITIDCALTPPNAGDTFPSTATCYQDPVTPPCFIIKDGSVSFPEESANGCGTHAGFDLCKVTASALGGNSTFVSGSINLKSYASTNNNLLMGCLVQYAVNGNEANLMDLVETIHLVQAAPPSPPSLQSSINSFNPSTCSADIAWMTPPSDRTVDRYFLYLDGSLLATTTSNSYTHSTILNINTNYQYSLTASSCAGNSINNGSLYNIMILSYSFSMNNPLPACLSYNSDTGLLTITWELDSPSQPAGVSGINIEYSVDVTYSHSNETVTYVFTNSTSTFNLVSNVTTYNVALTAHNFTNPQGVETNVSAYVRILQQCGQSVGVQEIYCSHSSATPPTATPNIISTSSSSILTSVSSTLIPTPTISTTTTTTTTTTFPPASQLNKVIVAGLIGGISVVSLIAVLFIILVIVLGIWACFFKGGKKDSHPQESGVIEPGYYDYVVINEVSEHRRSEPDHSPYYSQVTDLPGSDQPSGAAPSVQEGPYYTQISELPRTRIEEMPDYIQIIDTPTYDNI